MGKVKKWPWPLILTTLHWLNMLSVSTNFHVIGFKTSWKIQHFHFFPLKSLCNQNWPCHKIGQGQPKVMIYINYHGPESLMLHNKFHWNCSTGSREEDSFMFFYHIWAWPPSWSCDLDHFYKLLFPLPKDAPHEVWLWLAQRFQRRRSLKMWTDDGRTPEHGHPISSPCEPSVQVS